MADAGTVKLVLYADARPAVDSINDIRDMLEIRAATSASERRAALERMRRRHLSGAADVFEASAARRRRLDPRRLSDRWHAQALRRWVERSEEAEGNARAASG